MLQSWNVHCSSVAIPGREAMEWWNSLWNSWGSVWTGLWAEPRDPGRATNSSTCSCQLLWRSWEEKFLTWQLEEMHAEKIKVGWGWGARENQKRNWQEIASFYPIVEIPSDARDVSFSYSLVYSLCMFLSEGVRQRKQQSGCSLVCYSALVLPLHTGFLLPVSLMLMRLQKLLCFQKHLSARARAQFIASCDQEQN